MLADGRLPNLAQLKARGGLLAADADRPGADAGLLGDVLDRARPGRHADLRLPQARSGQPHPDVRRRGGDLGSAPPRARKPAPAAAAAAAAILLLPALVLLAKRRRVAALVLALLGVAAGVGAYRAVRAWVPETRPWVRNNRRGPVFWTEAGARPATVMRMPVTFPPDAFADGRMLSGLGVPDLSGRIGRPSFYTSDPFFAVARGQRLLRRGRAPRVEHRHADRTPRRSARPRVRQGGDDRPAADADGASRRATVSSSRRAARAPSSRPGQWSEWLPLSFRVNPLVSVHGYARMRLASVKPEIALYVSPIQFDPDHLPPGFEISSPARFRAGPRRIASAASRRWAGRSTRGRSSRARFPRTRSSRTCG